MAKRNKQLDLEEAIARQVLAEIDMHGREVPDPTPMAPPVGFIKQPSMIENIRNLVRSEALRQAALTAGAETFEEAEDFDVDDDIDPTSPYEQNFELAPAEALKAYVPPEELDPHRKSPTPAPGASSNPPSDGPGTPSAGTPVPSPTPAPAPKA